MEARSQSSQPDEMNFNLNAFSWKRWSERRTAVRSNFEMTALVWYGRAVHALRASRLCHGLAVRSIDELARLVQPSAQVFVRACQSLRFTPSDARFDSFAPSLSLRPSRLSRGLPVLGVRPPSLTLLMSSRDSFTLRASSMSWLASPLHSR